MANRDLWERLLEATKRHQEVRWRKVKGYSKTAGPHKSGNDRADELAVAAKKEASGMMGKASGKKSNPNIGKLMSNDGDRLQGQRAKHRTGSPRFF